MQWLLSLLLGNPLDRILKSVDKSMDNETERERIKADTVKAFTAAKVSVLTGPGWWFPLFFIVPLGVWFSSVCIYSVLWCSACAFPQAWSIAALPKPLDEWAGMIVSAMFIGGSGMAIASGLKK
jgi:hypothetical protein